MSDVPRPEAGEEFPYPMELDLGEAAGPVRFASLAEFEASLDDLDTLAREQEAALPNAPAAALRAEAQRVQHAAGLLDPVLEAAASGAGAADAALSALDPGLLAGDRGWRELLEALARQPPVFAAAKRLALQRYRRHLARRGAALAAARRHPGPAQSPEAETHYAPGQAPTGHGPFGGEAPDGEPFERLPRGARVDVEIPAGVELPVRLASHEFRIVAREMPWLADEHGGEWMLREGRNLLGRALHNDIVIGPAYVDVSRSHLIIEVADGAVVGMTDLSSRGTSLPRGRFRGGGEAD